MSSSQKWKFLHNTELRKTRRERKIKYAKWKPANEKTSACSEQEGGAVAPRRKEPEKLKPREHLPGMSDQAISEEAQSEHIWFLCPLILTNPFLLACFRPCLFILLLPHTTPLLLSFTSLTGSSFSLRIFSELRSIWHSPGDWMGHTQNLKKALRGTAAPWFQFSWVHDSSNVMQFWLME